MSEQLQKKQPQYKKTVKIFKYNRYKISNLTKTDRLRLNLACRIFPAQSEVRSRLYRWLSGRIRESEVESDWVRSDICMLFAHQQCLGLLELEWLSSFLQKVAALSFLVFLTIAFGFGQSSGGWIKLWLGVTKSSLEISVDACSSDQSVNYLAKQINKSALGATFIWRCVKK